MHDTFPEVLPQGQFTTVSIPGANTTTVVNPGTQHLGKGTVTFNPTLVLNAGYAFSNGNIVSTPAGFLSLVAVSEFQSQLVFPNTVGVIPTVSINGMQNMNGSIAYVDHGTNHQGFGDVTKVYKNHTFISASATTTIRSSKTIRPARRGRLDSTPPLNSSAHQA